MIQAEDIKTIAIAGTGVMGSSMAQIFAQYGYDVILYGRHQESMDKGCRMIELSQETLVLRGELTKDASDKLVSRIRFSKPGDINVFGEADFVVENVTESLEAKQNFWKDCSEAAKPDAVLTTNTSGLSITKIAEAVKSPKRFCGMHFWNPPHIIPLIEVIRGDKTDEEAADITYALSEKIGKKPIHVRKDAPGFIGNRLQFALLREALYIKEQGVGDFEDIDRCMKYGPGFRYACLGPFEVADFGGLDTFHHISSYLWEDLSDAKKPYGLFDELYKQGKFGVKSGSGFYDYSGGKGEKAMGERDEKYLKLAKCGLDEEEK
ncbi:MAG: 3-hydroxyacyl-CoA dehydrogenase family protein [Eubacteriales bacterium]|nr:3-hydroxyacyl-CoA dehydrogenase family protein [Eubacteriales bacterium]